MPVHAWALRKSSTIPRLNLAFEAYKYGQLERALSLYTRHFIVDSEDARSISERLGIRFSKTQELEIITVHYTIHMNHGIDMITRVREQDRKTLEKLLAQNAFGLCECDMESLFKCNSRGTRPGGFVTKYTGYPIIRTVR